MMTPKENFYAMINNEQPEYAPCMSLDYNLSVLLTNNADQPWQGGVDPFGVAWVATHEGPIPKPGDFKFTEIEDWDKNVKFPNIDSLGMEQMAAVEMQNFDPVCTPSTKEECSVGIRIKIIYIFNECHQTID